MSPSRATSTPTPRRRSAARRTYVLDTSVLLADPGAIARFDEHEVVLPIVVITELEAKRAHPELGWFARQSLRLLDELRLAHGRLDVPLPVNDAGGTVRVELNHTDPTSLPPGYRLGDNDSRLLAVARNLAAEGADVVLVSKDMPLRIKAASIGLHAQEYLAEQVESGWTGMAELEIAGADVDALYDRRGARHPGRARELPCHTGLVLLSERARARSGHAGQAGTPRPRRPRGVRRARSQRRAARSRSTCCSIPTSASSRSAAAPAPASPRSRCAPGSRRCMERHQHRKVVVFRPLYAVGGQELGYLPGTRRRRCRRGGRRSSTPSARWSHRT